MGQFPLSVHVETVVLMSKVEKQMYEKSLKTRSLRDGADFGNETTRLENEKLAVNGNIST